MWAGTINFESGEHLVAVEFDTDDTAALLRDRCAEWSSSDTSGVPAAFGVRIARVGLRRRTVGVVHHGAPIRHRVESAEAAVEAIATFLEEIGRPQPEGKVVVEARAFARGDRVVLLDVLMSIDVDERPLGRLGIVEIPTFRPLLDLATGNVTVDGVAYPLAGVAVQNALIQSLDDARRRLWSLGHGPSLRWAEFIDQLGDRLTFNAPDLAAGLDQLLG